MRIELPHKFSFTAWPPFCIQYTNSAGGRKRSIRIEALIQQTLLLVTLALQIPWCVAHFSSTPPRPPLLLPPPNRYKLLNVWFIPRGEEEEALTVFINLPQHFFFFYFSPSAPLFLSLSLLFRRVNTNKFPLNCRKEMVWKIVKGTSIRHGVRMLWHHHKMRMKGVCVGFDSICSRVGWWKLHGKQWWDARNNVVSFRIIPEQGVSETLLIIGTKCSWHKVRRNWRGLYKMLWNLIGGKEIMKFSLETFLGWVAGKLNSVAQFHEMLNQQSSDAEGEESEPPVARLRSSSCRITHKHEEIIDSWVNNRHCTVSTNDNKWSARPPSSASRKEKLSTRPESI